MLKGQIKFYKIFKELTLILQTLLKKTDEGTLPILFYEDSITLITKPGKDITRKLQISIPYEHWYKNPQQNNKSTQQRIKGLYTPNTERDRASINSVVLD